MIDTFRKPTSSIRFKIAIGGDVCPGPFGAQLSREGRASGVFAPVASFLENSDLRVVQFESPLPRVLAPIPKSGPNLDSKPETVDVIAGRFDVALLANNHIGDHGPEGVLDTIRELNARRIRTVGAGRNLEDAAAPLRIEAAGHPVSVFNFAEYEFGIASENSPGAAQQRPLADMRAVAAEVAAGRTVMVVLHGGHEQYPFPSPRLRDLCRAYADAGASFVVNCHEHCPQGFEWHHGVPIIYSPGNLWFPPSDVLPARSCPRLWNVGYLVKVSFDGQGPFSLDLLPYEAGPDAVRPMESPATETFEKYLRHLCEPLSNPPLLQSYFDAWCVESGRGYLKGAIRALGGEWEARGHDAACFLPMRNLFTCESHNDLVRGYLRIAAEGRMEAASRLRPDIVALQNPVFSPSIK